jgi:hypothetical protein
MVRKIGIDISAYQGRPDPSWFDGLPSFGVEVGWVQAWGGTPNGRGPNPHAQYQLSQFRRVGLDIGMYIWYPPEITADQIETVNLDAEVACGNQWQNLLFGTADFESPYDHAMSDEMLFRLILRLADRMHPRPVDVYTSASEWAKLTANSRVLHAIPLHEAYYYRSMPTYLTIRDAFEYQTIRDAFDKPFGLVPSIWPYRAAWQVFGGEAHGVGADWNIFDYDRMGITALAPILPKPLPMGGDDDMPLTVDQEKNIAAIPLILKALGYGDPATVAAGDADFVDSLPKWLNRVLGLRTSDDPADNIPNATLIATLEEAIKAAIPADLAAGTINYDLLTTKVVNALIARVQSIQ